MKRILFLMWFAAVAVVTTNAQQATESVIKSKLLEAGLTPVDVNEVLVTDKYQTKHNGVTHIYFKQVYQGIEVDNAVGAIHIKNTEVVGFNQNFVQSLASNVQAKQPSINPNQAIAATAQVLGLQLPEQLNKTGLELTNNKCELSVSKEISSEPIKVKLVYYVTEKNEVKLAYQTNWLDVKTGNWWNVWVDAISGAFLYKNNWSIACNHQHAQGYTHSHHASVNTNLQIQKTLQSLSKKSATISYRAFPIGVESPAHGERVLLTNPWDSLASPYGWHDTDGVAGADHSITKGNNVYAYEDANNRNAPGYSPDAGESMTYDYPFDTAGTPQFNLNAAITNLFVWNNFMHDVFYHYGFDEESGNFQLNNYGRGGEDNDAVNAEAQDGSGTNNANFVTPADGAKPRMQMFLWKRPSSPADLLFTQTSTNNDSFSYATSSIGPKEIDFTNVEVVLVRDTATGSTLGCNPITQDLTGKIALIDRGTCAFVQKIRNAQAAGAVMVIIANNQNFAFNITGTASDITIPSIMISSSAGNTIKNRLVNDTVYATINNVNSISSAFDSDFDNGVIAHEYTHGISNRLTGGPSNSNCLTNQEQAGEGWSDFFALVITHKVTDNPEVGRGIATWLVGQPNSGLGIRNFRYSRNLNVNPTTYDAIKTLSIPHGVGSVWCTMLYDLYWNLIDKYGYDADLYNGNGGNNRAIQLVMDGMKLQPCNPGFVDARDAIIQANKLNNNGEDTALIWSTFARRGLGYSAKQGSAGSRSDGTEAYDLPTASNTFVAKINAETGMSFWPNPTNGAIEFMLPEQAVSAQVELYDIAGKLVFQQQVTADNRKLNLGELPNGAYVIKATSNGKVFTSKLIMAH